MNTKIKKSLTVLFALSAFIFSAHFETKAQKADARYPILFYPVSVYEVVGGKIDEAGRQKFRVGKDQPVRLRHSTPKKAQSQFWLTVSRGYTALINQRYTNNRVLGELFRVGKYKIQTGEGFLSAVITVKKN